MGKTIAAGIFIINKENKLLVCHPTNHAPDFWSISKGKVEEGEEFHEAALRETYEETNLQLNEEPFRGQFSIHALEMVNYVHGKKVLHPFLYWELPNSTIDWNTIEIKCNSNVPEARGGFPEMDAYKWVDIKEASMIIHDTQIACLDAINEILAKKKEYLDLID